MLKGWQYWALCVLGALSLALVGLNIVLVQANRVVQGSVSARAQYLQQSEAIGSVYREMAQALHDLAVKSQDAAVTAMLVDLGVQSGAGAPPVASPAAGPAPAVRP